MAEVIGAATQAEVVRMLLRKAVADYNETYRNYKSNPPANVKEGDVWEFMEFSRDVRLANADAVRLSNHLKRKEFSQALRMLGQFMGRAKSLSSRSRARWMKLFFSGDQRYAERKRFDTVYGMLTGISKFLIAEQEKAAAA